MPRSAGRTRRTTTRSNRATERSSRGRDTPLLPELGSITILKQTPKFDCAYPGQTGKIYRRHADDSLYCLLKCGHPFTVKPKDIGISVEVVLDDSVRSDADEASDEEDDKGVQQMKQTKVPNAKGVIQVQGYEDQVKTFKTDLTFLQQLTKRLDGVKKNFRDLALQAAGNVGDDVGRVEFVAEDGSCVPVSFADISKATNRTAVSSKAYKDAFKLGVDLNELGVTEVEETFVLTGEWISWFQNVLQQYEAQGQPAPDGYTHKETTKLSEEGIAKLKEMAKSAKTENEQKAAQLLLGAGIKSPTVSAK